MNPDKQRIAIAEACGNKPSTAGALGVLRWITSDREAGDIGDGVIYLDELPDYLNDLNAMHEAEKLIIAGNRIAYCRNVLELVCPKTKGVIVELHAGYGISILHATAAQRAEAFLRTLGKWEDDK